MNLITAEKASIYREGHLIVDKADFSLAEGECMLLAGENGSGKTTLLRALLGLITPGEGKIVYHNGYSAHLAGYLPQQGQRSDAFPASCREIVMSGFLGGEKRFFPSGAQREKAAEICSRLEIGQLLKKPFFTLSGGQKQRVLLARALCAAKKALFLDEPTSFLDYSSRGILKQIIEELCDNKVSVVVVSHEAYLPGEYDKIITLKEGRCLYEAKGGLGDA